MRNYIFILLWCFIFCACSKNETSIQLQIKGDITDAHPRIVTSDSTYLLTLDSTGACKIILPAMQERYIWGNPIVYSSGYYSFNRYGEGERENV